MTLFSFKEKLNNGFARGINIVVWVIVFITSLASGDIKIPFWWFFVASIVTGIATPFCLEKTVEETTFCEWDYTERKKKFRFITMYVMICSALWVFISVDAFLIYKVFINEFHWFIKLIPIILFFFFVFNLLNICSLFYPLFEYSLKPAHKLQNKPKNWQEDGPEINDDAEIFDDIIDII